MFPQFGYNYEFLAPIQGNPAAAQPASATSAADPANTVMITSKWIHSDQPGWASGTVWGTGPFPGGSLADADAEGPVCGPLAQNCFSTGVAAMVGTLAEQSVAPPVFLRLKVDTRLVPHSAFPTKLRSRGLTAMQSA